MIRKKTGWLMLALVIACYAFMYTETKKDYVCNDDCQKVQSVDASLRRSYLYSIGRCSYQGSDTLCVWVKDTTGVNWSVLADTTCLIATQNGLYKQKLFFISYDTSRHIFDTLLVKQCP